jgi:hypothetical protein
MRLGSTEWINLKLDALESATEPGRLGVIDDELTDSVMDWFWTKSLTVEKFLLSIVLLR